jgi:hypothetical protein
VGVLTSGPGGSAMSIGCGGLIGPACGYIRSLCLVLGGSFDQADPGPGDLPPDEEPSGHCDVPEPEGPHCPQCGD